MRYRVTAAVESRAKLPSLVQLDDGNYEYTLDIDDEGLLNRISVECPVASYSELLPVIRKVEDRIQVDLRHLDSPLHTGIVEALQYMESLGSLFLFISAISWREAEWEWIPESGADRLAISVQSSNLHRVYPDEPVETPPELVAQIVAARPRLQELMTVPSSFFREGGNDYRSHKYATAFMYYYMYLEHLYGNGKTKNHQVERELMKSKHVVGGIGNWLDHLSSELGNPDFLAGLQALLDERKWPRDAEHIVKLLVSVRGEVHHSSGANRRRVAHAINQESYRTMAYLAQSMCVYSMVRILDDHELPQ